MHILRHTFCSRLAMAGAPAKAIQELAGHQNRSITQRYAPEPCGQVGGHAAARRTKQEAGNENGLETLRSPARFNRRGRGDRI
ncbi:tyrosine-type recombinase/integrase [Pyxidicoccus trucidator]|uniref:tyrosine-type recombinase/integrase n=1 Tax=Pyxidicoccus trucidator TaxID=2709662 RepID=UPI003B8394F8